MNKDKERKYQVDILLPHEVLSVISSQSLPNLQICQQSDFWYEGGRAELTTVWNVLVWSPNARVWQNRVKSWILENMIRLPMFVAGSHYIEYLHSVGFQRKFFRQRVVGSVFSVIDTSEPMDRNMVRDKRCDGDGAKFHEDCTSRQSVSYITRLWSCLSTQNSIWTSPATDF